MALKPLNSVGGFSVGETPTNVIFANGDITTANITISNYANLGNVGNIYIGGGSNGQFLSTDGSGNLTWASTATATSIENGNSNVSIPTANGNVYLNANAGVDQQWIFDTTGNTAFPAAGVVSLGNLITANYANFANDVVVQGNIANANNISVTNNITSDTANVTGNLTAGNANLGNLVTANYANFANDVVVQGNIANANNISVTNNITSNTANVTANLTAGNINGGNLVTANNFSTNGSGGDVTLTGGNVTGANVVIANSFTSNGGVVDFNTNNANVQLGSNANVYLYGGTTGQVLTTDGSGNISWTDTGSTSSIENGSSNVSIPDTNGNVYINANAASNQQWNFETTGNTSFPAIGVVSLGNLITANYANFANDVVVQGNIANANNITATNNITSNTANVTGNLTAGNANLGNLITANYANFANDVVVQGNIANANNISVTNNITSNTANVTANLTAGNVVTNTIAGATTGVTIQATGTDQNITLVPTGTGYVDVNAARIGNLATPTAATDAATKQYVDDVAQGLHTHASCNVATTGSLASISGGSVTYDNGTDGVGATLTLGVGITVIDGVTLSNGMRILVKNEANTAHNGIYDRTSATVLTRSTDFDNAAEIAGGDFTFVTSGTVYNSTGWVQIDEVTTVGTDPIVWEQFSGAGSYTAGTGLTLTGTVFSISNTAVTAASYGSGDSVATFTVNDQGQLTAASNTFITANAANLTGTTLASGVVNSSLTSVGTLTSLDVSGNVNFTTAANVALGSNSNVHITGGSAGQYLQTDGAGVLTWSTISSSGISNGTSNVNIATANGNIDLTSSGNTTMIVTSTGVDVTGYANISGNLSAGNISATNGNLTTANVSGNIVLGNATVTTTLTWASVTTTSITAAQPIASFPIAGVTGVEYLVKGIDASGAKYSIASVIAVTDGTNVDYTIFGTIDLGTSTGSLSVAKVASNIVLQVTPSSTNSTVWTTQYKLI